MKEEKKITPELKASALTDDELEQVSGGSDDNFYMMRNWMEQIRNSAARDRNYNINDPASREKAANDYLFCVGELLRQKLAAGIITATDYADLESFLYGFANELRNGTVPV